MQGIEDKIKRNREAFNSEEPAPDHLKRFGEKLDAFHADEPESWFERHGMAIRIAAAALVFVAIGSFFSSNLYNRLKGVISDRIVAAELPAELKEVMQYYNVITDKKVSQIDELAVSEDEASRVKEMALRELQALEDHHAELEKEYAMNPNSERIMNAMLVNQQKRSEILDKIITTLNQVN